MELSQNEIVGIISLLITLIICIILICLIFRVLIKHRKTREETERTKQAIASDEKVYFFEPLEKEISVEDMQKIVDANEKVVKDMKDGNNSMLVRRKR